jgi:hypothetical protein
MADSNAVIARYAFEDDLGVIPEVAFNTFRVTSVSINPDYQTIQSEEIINTLRARGMVRTTQSATMELGFELSFRTLRDMLSLMVMNHWEEDEPELGTDRLVDGIIRKSMTCEAHFTDVDLVLWVLGARAQSLSLSLQREQMVTGTIQLMGLEVDGGTVSQGTGTPTPRTTTDPLNSLENLTVLNEGGAGLSKVESMELSFSRDLEPKGELGTAAAWDIRVGELENTGQIQTHLRSLDLFNKAKDFVDSSLELLWEDRAGNELGVEFPRIQYENFQVQVGGRNQDVFGDAPWRASAADDETPQVIITEREAAE